MTDHKFSWRAITIVLGVVLAMILTTVVVLGHTGSITNTQDCQNGTRIFAHLDGNVSADRTFSVEINGVVVDSGNGPGPKDLGPYAAGFTSGSATLHISVNNEDENSYTTEFGPIVDCPSESESPSPSESPSDTPSPSETPTVSESASPSETPTQTIPNTSIDTPSVDFGGPIFLFAGFLLVGLAVLLIADALSRRTRS